jgi:hypothetical protein
MNARRLAPLLALATAGCLDLGTRPEAPDAATADAETPDAHRPIHDASPSRPDAVRPAPDAATTDAATADAATTDAARPDAATPDAVRPAPDAAPPAPDLGAVAPGLCGGRGPLPRRVTPDATRSDYLAGFAALPRGDAQVLPHHFGRVMADFDCDGRQDLLLTRRSSDRFTLLYGAPFADGLPLADGRLDVVLPAGFTAYTATAADLDADAVPELVILARSAGVVGGLRLLTYRVDPALGGFGEAPLVADISGGFNQPDTIDPAFGGPFPVGVVRGLPGARPTLVQVTLAEVSLFPLPAEDTQAAWNRVVATRLVPDALGGRSFTAAQWPIALPRADGGEELVIAEDHPGHRFRQDPLGWQRLWRGPLAEQTRRIFVPVQADADPELEYLSAFQHGSGVGNLADLLDPLPPGDAAPFAVLPIVAEGVFSQTGAWFSAAALDVDANGQPELLFGGQAEGGPALWFVPDVAWSEVSDAVVPMRPPALRGFAGFSPDGIFWGDFDGDAAPEALLFDDGRGLLCVRPEPGAAGQAPAIRPCE